MNANIYKNQQTGSYKPLKRCYYVNRKSIKGI